MANGSQAGWYPDPMRKFQHRYWDGSRWTEHASTGGEMSIDPLPSAPGPTVHMPPTEPNFPAESSTAVASSSEGATTPPPAEAQTPRVPSGPTQGGTEWTPNEKITTFNAKRVAHELQVENQRLLGSLGQCERLLAELGALDVAAREQRIEAQRQTEEAVRQHVAQLQRQVNDLEGQVIVNRDRLILEEVGLFDFEHPAEASAALATELEALRSDIRQTNKIGSAITAAPNFTFNNSLAKGKTFVNQMSRIMLRAYNAEAENAVKTVKAGNLTSAQKRLSTAREQIAKQGQMIDLAVTDHYHRLRLRELELAARHEQAKAADRQQERERRAELREQRSSPG